MLVLIVLVAAWLVFRAMGAAGVHVLASWQHSALYALALMFVFTAMAHFNKNKHLIALLIGMFIANINAAQKGITLRGKPSTPLWLRTPMQILFIGLLWWSTRA